MLRWAFTRALTTLNSPTADLYFANACVDWLTDGRIVRHAPTVFTSASTQLIIRHDARAGRAARRGRRIYLLDDAIDLRGADEALSPYWRFKLKVVERAAADHYLPGADAVVVSSPALAEMIRERLPDGDIRVLHPYWSEPVSSLGHHAKPRLTIAYLGSQTHGPDIAPLVPMLARFLDETPEAELVMAGGHEQIGPLASHGQVRALGPMPWATYRRKLGALGVHVALYPLNKTPFNAARSLNKLIEHGIAGAAGLYADNWPGARLAEDAGAGFSLPPDPAAWAAALGGLVADRDRTHQMAAAGTALASKINDGAAQRALWSELLRVDSD
ncbi:MAG: hypothetical protein AAF367_18685 [Pseudomonadota bacterium]